jgi:hypothetical protein
MTFPADCSRVSLPAQATPALVPRASRPVPFSPTTFAM